MIAITPAAASHLRTLLQERAGEDEVFSGLGDRAEARGGLRILVEKGGCAGMQYAMSLGEWREGDEVSEAEGVRVFMDTASAGFLKGSVLDYCDDLIGTGFRLQNPNAARSCGCGTSFEPGSGDASGSSEPASALAHGSAH